MDAPKKLFITFSILGSHFCFCQFNDTTHYYTSLASTGIFNKTNDGKSYVLNNSFRFSVYKKNISVNSTSGFIYGEQQDKLSNQDFSTTLDFNALKKNNPIYLWGLGSYEKSFSLKINNRLQAGLGPGYTVIDRKNVVVVISDGVLYEKGNLEAGTEGENKVYEILRNSFRIKFRLLMKDKIVFENTDFIQHALSDKHDYIIRSQTNFSFKLMRWMSLTAGLTYNKLSRTDRENLLFNFGLSLERYF
jgi:hypothetical protein